MNKVVKYGSVVASIIGIIAVVIAGIKLASNNYDIVCEGIIIGICFVVLFISAVIKIASKQSKQTTSGLPDRADLSQEG